MRFFENDRVNSITKAELQKVADFGTRKATLMSLLEEKRPTRAKPFINEGLCYRQAVIKAKGDKKKKPRNHKNNNNNNRRKGGHKGKFKGKGKPNGKGGKKFVNRTDSEGNPLCNKCGNTGHIFKDCPKKNGEKK